MNSALLSPLRSNGPSPFVSAPTAASGQYQSIGLPQAQQLHAMLDGIERLPVQILDGGRPNPLGIPGRPMNYADQRLWESQQGPHLAQVNRFFDPTLDGKLATLEQFVDQRIERYLKAHYEATDPKMKAYYLDLYGAMVTDRADLANWRQLGTHTQKADLYNRLVLEVEVEIKHNVIVARNSGKQWTEQDLRNLDRGLQAAGRTILEGDLHMLAKEQDVVDSRGRRASASYNAGVVTFSDQGTGDSFRSNVARSVLHQIGLSKAPWGPYMDRLMKDSGWQRVGDQNVPALASYNHGDLALAKDLKKLGVAEAKGFDDGQYLRVSKKDGHAFILPTTTQPDQPGKVVSRLAAESPWEDFAETYAEFCQDPQGLKDKFPEKYQLMSELRQIGYL